MIAVAGEAVIDAHLDGDVLRLHPGGGPFNTAVALARLGVPACFVGGISRDPLGELLENELRSAGVAGTDLARVEAPTPLAVVDPSGPEARYSFYLTGTAYQDLDAERLPPLPRPLAAVHIGTLGLATDPPASAVELLAAREAPNAVIVVDPNVRPAAIGDRDAYVGRLERILAYSDLVKASESDLAWIYPDLDVRDAAEHLLRLGPGCVVVTHGAAGASASTVEASARVAAPAVAVADTIGAGDAFGAALLARLWRSSRLDKESIRSLRADELEAALAYAAAVAALQCTRPSAWAPTSDDVERFLEQPGSMRLM